MLKINHYLNELFNKINHAHITRHNQLQILTHDPRFLFPHILLIFKQTPLTLPSFLHFLHKWNIHIQQIPFKPQGYLLLKNQKHQQTILQKIAHLFIQQWGNANSQLTELQFKQFLLPNDKVQRKQILSRHVTNKKIDEIYQLYPLFVKVIRVQLQNLYQLTILTESVHSERYTSIQQLLRPLQYQISHNQLYRFLRSRGSLLSKQQIHNVFLRLSKGTQCIYKIRLKKLLDNRFDKQYYRIFIPKGHISHIPQIGANQQLSSDSSISQKYSQQIPEYRTPQPKYFIPDGTTKIKPSSSKAMKEFDALEMSPKISKFYQKGTQSSKTLYLKQQPQKCAIDYAVDFIRQIILQEMTLDQLRNQIALSRDFNILQVFKSIDKSKRKKISQREFQTFLQQIDLHDKLDNVEYIFKRYCKGGKSKNMIFTQFCYLILPNNIQYLHLISTRDTPALYHQTVKLLPNQILLLQTFFSNYLTAIQNMRSYIQFLGERNISVDELFDLISNGQNKIRLYAIKQLLQGRQQRLVINGSIGFFRRLQKLQNQLSKQAFIQVLV